MIRTYFMSVVQHHGDGKGSFSHNHSICEIDNDELSDIQIYKEMKSEMRKILGDLPGAGIELQVLAFNKVG